MFRIFMLAGAFIMGLVSFTHSDQGPNFDEGQWEITVKFGVPGMPMEMPPIIYKQCMTKENPIPEKDKPHQTCETKEIKTKGNTLTWTAECTNRGGKMQGNGTITYEKDTMTGSMTMTMEGQAMKIESQYTGKRIGKCK